MTATRHKTPLPKISIISPSYQQGEFIEDTIQSVISQEYPFLEYIVIDGESSDNSVAIIKRYESRISFWISEKDRGQTDALNKGFRKATGEIIGWINSDDMLLPGALKKVGSFFQMNPDVSMIYGDAQAVDRHGKPLFIRKPGSFDLRWLIRTDDIPQSSVFFRRDFLVSIGYLDDRLHFALDYDLLIKAGLHQDLVYLPETLSAFRIYPETKTSGGKTQFSVDIVYFIDNILRNNPPNENHILSLLTTQYWRIFEIILDRETGKNLLNNLKNDPFVTEITESYVDTMYPHFFKITELPFSIDPSRLDSILNESVSDLLAKYPDRLGLSDTCVKRWIRQQRLDIIIFSFRLWKCHWPKISIRLFSNICLSIPSLLKDTQFRKIIMKR